MICEPCHDGMKLKQKGKIEEGRASHAQCPGTTWCDCQHGGIPVPAAIKAADAGT